MFVRLCLNPNNCKSLFCILFSHASLRVHVGETVLARNGDGRKFVSCVVSRQRTSMAIENKKSPKKNSIIIVITRIKIVVIMITHKIMVITTITVIVLVIIIIIIQTVPGAVLDRRFCHPRTTQSLVVIRQNRPGGSLTPFRDA